MSTSGWPLVRLRDLGTWFGGGTPSKSNREFWADGTMPWLSPKDMGPEVLAGTQDHITQDAVEKSSVKRVPAGSVALVVRSGILDRTLPVAFVPFDTTLNQDMKAIAARPDIDAKWIAWGLRASEQEILRTCRKAGTTVASMEMPRLYDHTMPIPPLDQQRRIVDILEDHLSRLDAAQAGLTRAGSACAVLNLSVLTEIHRSLLDASVKLEPLGEVCDTALGKMLDAKKASGTPTPYLGNINVRWGSFDLSGLRTVPLNDDERARFEVKPGDLLVCEGGEPGRCAVWVDGPSGITYQKAVHRVRAKDPNSVAPDFVALLLEEFIRMGRADRMFTGTTIRHLPQEKLRAIELPIPDLQTQRATVDRVAAHVQTTSRLSHEVSRIAHEGAALRRALLAAAFSGRLTGRTTDIEIVEEIQCLKHVG